MSKVRLHLITKEDKFRIIGNFFEIVSGLKSKKEIIDFFVGLLHIVSELVRPTALALRLFGNIMGEDLVMAILLLLAGKFLAPLPMMFLGVFTSFVQAFIFALLSMMYIAGSMEEGH